MNKTLLAAIILCALFISTGTAVSADSKNAKGPAAMMQLAANLNTTKSLPKSLNSKDPLIRKHFGKNTAISTQDGVDEGRPCSFSGFRKKNEERCQEITVDGTRYNLCCEYVCSYSCQSQTDKPRGTPGGSFLGKQSGTCRKTAKACSATIKAGSTSPSQTLGN